MNYKNQLLYIFILNFLYSFIKRKIVVSYFVSYHLKDKQLFLKKFFNFKIFEH